LVREAAISGRHWQHRDRHGPAIERWVGPMVGWDRSGCLAELHGDKS